VATLRQLTSDIYLLLVMVFIDLPLLLFMRRPTQHDRSICIIRLDNIGDFILWLDAANGLHELFAGRPSVLVIDEALAELAKDAGLWDEVWPLNRKRFRQDPQYRLHVLRKVRRRGFHTAIHPAFSRDFSMGDALTLATAATKRIGYQGDLSNMRRWQKWLGDRCYTQLVAAEPQSTMELIRNADFVRAIGNAAFRARCPRLPVPLGRHRTRPVDAPYYVLFPGASRANKQWPPASFATVAEWLSKHTGLQGVICGGRDDRPQAAIIEKHCQATLVNLTGTTTLRELVDIITGAALLISNDTSAVHIACAVGTKSIAILGGGHYGRFLPYQVEVPCATPPPIVVHHPMDCFGCNWQCRYSTPANAPAPCVERVTADAVIAAIAPLLPLADT
jgi:ADP-heptose:LPS heptosyltransferase